MTSISPVRADLKTEWLQSPRWVRVRFGGAWVADSKRPMLLRQHGFLPVYYFPEADVRTELLVPTDHRTFSPYKGEARYWHVEVGDRVARYAVWSYPSPREGSPDTHGYYGFDWHSMDEWYEEAERLHVHARDPYLRVDAAPSSRHVVVEVGGTVVADTKQPVLVFETGLVTRYYVPPEDVQLDLLRPSSTYTMCPYKGRARYYDVVVDGRVYADAVWQYPEPLSDVTAVRGCLGFWNEREDTTIVVDGTPVERLEAGRTVDGSEPLPAWRRFWAVPQPESMRGAGPGQYQLDFARPNRRAEGPPDEVMDMAIERAGGKPDEWLD